MNEDKEYSQKVEQAISLLKELLATEKIFVSSEVGEVIEQVLELLS